MQCPFLRKNFVLRPLRFFDAFLHLIDLLLQVWDLLHSNVVNRVLLLHFFQNLLELYDVRVRLYVEVRWLNLLIAFHQVAVFCADNLAQNAMSVQDVQIFAEFLLFDDPGWELVDFGLFLVLLQSEMVQKLFLLPVLVDKIDEFIFEVGFFVGDGFGWPYGWIELLPFTVDIKCFFLKELGSGFFGLEGFLSIFIMNFLVILVFKEAFFDVGVAFFDPLCGLFGLLFWV